MAATPVQNVGPSTGSQQFNPIAEASGQWKTGLRTSLDATRVDGVVKPNLVAQAAYQSMIAPAASGVALGDLPPHDATALLEARRVGMTAAMVDSFGANLDREGVELLTAGLPNDAATEILEGWAKNIRKNAKLDKEAHKRAMLMARMLKAARDGAFNRAMANHVTGNAATTMSQNTTNRQPVQNRTPGVRASNQPVRTIAAGGVAGAFTAPTAPMGIGTARKNRFG